MFRQQIKKNRTIIQISKLVSFASSIKQNKNTKSSFQNLIVSCHVPNNHCLYISHNQNLNYQQSTLKPN